MGATKRQIILDAFGELALGSESFDISPDEMQKALRRLDTMIAGWSERGIRLGYVLGGSAPDLDTDSNLPGWAEEAVAAHLAIRLAPGYGKTPSNETKRVAREAMERLTLAAAQPPQQRLRDGVPLGAGNKTYGSVGAVFTPTPDTSPLQVADDGGLQLGG